jgi:tight adherence protein B
MSPTIIIIFVLVSLSMAAISLAAHSWLAGDRSSMDRRIERISSLAQSSTGQAARKRSIEETLREISERNQSRQRAKPSLLLRMRQADLAWSKTTYHLVSAASGLATLIGLHVATGVGLFAALGFGLATGLLVPHLYVGTRRGRRLKAFSLEFPNALDVIVRGVRSGLPLVDCIKIVAAEAQDPVKAEFKAIAEDQAVGMPLQEAIERLPDRVPLPEASFFAIVIAMQTQTGGSLAEALANLSTVLRERKKMKAKVKAISSEAKASAWIIGLLPVLVAGMIFLTSPKYISLLFTTGTGKIVLLGCAVWMMIGTLVMRKMINFDF